MKQVYCSNCGAKLAVFQKALPQYSRVISVVRPHECTEEVAEPEWDLTPFPMPPNIATINDDKFVKKLNETLPKLEPGDRRSKEHIKSDGQSVYDNVKNKVLQQIPSVPVNEPLDGEPSDGE